MKVSFARKYQEGAAIAGTLGSADAPVAGGDLISPRVYSNIPDDAFEKWGTGIKLGLDTIDVATDWLAGRAWERTAKEKINDLKAVKDAVSRSQALRKAALGQASLYDKSGVGTLAAASMLGLNGVGLYAANNGDFSNLARSIGKGIGTFIGKRLPSLDSNSIGDVYTIQDQGVESAGTPPVQVSTTVGSTAVTNSANQTSANPYSGYIQAAKAGTKLIRRFK